MKALRAGLVGVGQMGRNHARVLRNLDGIDLVAVVDPERDPNGVAGGLPVVESVESLTEFGLDCCVVASPTAFHLEGGLALAEAGIHTMIEKPIATNLDEADRLIAAFDSAGVVGCVGHVERFNPAIRSMRERIAHGELGDLYQISTRRQGPFVGRVADIGVVKDLGTHDIDLTMWLVSQPIIAVSARTAHRMGRQHEDLASITSICANDVVGNHIVNWLSPLKERVVQVTGERGSFVANTITADLTYWANGEIASEWESLLHTRGVTEGDVIRYAIPKPEPLASEAEAFRDAILDVRQDVVTLSEGRRVLAVAEACLESAVSGQTIELPPVRDN